MSGGCLRNAIHDISFAASRHKVGSKGNKKNILSPHRGIRLVAKGIKKIILSPHRGTRLVAKGIKKIILSPHRGIRLVAEKCKRNSLRRIAA